MAEEQTALVVDDEPDICELLDITLSRMHIKAHTAGTVAQAKTLLTRHRYDLCLTDMRLPDGNGIELVEHIQNDYPDIPTAVITAHGNVESAVQALKAGAFDFVSKPIDLNGLRTLVSSAIKVSQPEEPEESSNGNLTLLGDTPIMRATRATINKLSRSQAPVYIAGESGSGKELVARMIHQQGPRASHAFVPVNCGAIPEHLMESEFFGYKKGSFTGATSDKEGLFQAAKGGTLFLDEVADLPMHMQVKLLRAIQEKAVRPVGASKEIPIDVRILSATHKDLAALVAAGDFRQDLFYRINVIELRVPSLREHADDIPLLADHLLSNLAKHSGLDHIDLSDEALDALVDYDFPGNVRELENILERAMTLCEGDVIQQQDLRLPRDLKNQLLQAPVDKSVALDPYLDTMAREAIKQALEKTRYNKTAAAKLLGISFRQLRYRLKKLEID
ncbi:MAG: sigma-54 dependent transcriptional regulator [Gammaproteobacteria bacterium]|nr:sigma-54 dependent transcriptional regulator [Gammaproteobacteria bacterium]MDH5727692.1 sigma-54 dependent transcriptional regulator [Gammaproteobacteria bacterium]